MRAEMATTVMSGNDRLRNGKLQRRSVVIRRVKDFSLRTEDYDHLTLNLSKGKTLGMANVYDLNSMLLGYNDANVINDDELLLLHNVHRRRNPHFPYWRSEKFNLELMEEDECKAEFRMRRDDVYTLADTIRFPDNFKCYNGVVVDSIEALCICLRRLAYPCRYGDIVNRFARPVSQLSMITNLIIDEIYGRFANRLTSMDQPWLSSENLRMYADAIHAKGAALDTCWGFVDGTVRAICRPKVNQRAVCNGHKRVHTLKFQSVVAPNGLIGNLFGPVEDMMLRCWLYLVCWMSCKNTRMHPMVNLAIQDIIGMAEVSSQSLSLQQMSDE